MANKDSTIPNYVREASYLLCYGVTSRTCDNMIAQKRKRSATKCKFKDLSSSLYDLPFQRKHGSYLLVPVSSYFNAESKILWSLKKSWRMPVPWAMMSALHSPSFRTWMHERLELPQDTLHDK